MLFSYDILRKLIFTEYHINVIVAMVGGYEQLQKMACTLDFFERLAIWGLFLLAPNPYFVMVKLGCMQWKKIIF